MSFLCRNFRSPKNRKRIAVETLDLKEEACSCFLLTEVLCPAILFLLSDGQPSDLKSRPQSSALSPHGKLVLVCCWLKEVTLCVALCYLPASFPIAGPQTSWTRLLSAGELSLTTCAFLIQWYQFALILHLGPHIVSISVLEKKQRSRIKQFLKFTYFPCFHFIFPLPTMPLPPVATIAACGSIITAVKSSWELSRMIKKKDQEKRLDSQARAIVQDLKQLYLDGLMDERTFEKWYDRLLGAIAEKDGMCVCRRGFPVESRRAPPC